MPNFVAVQKSLTGNRKGRGKPGSTDYKKVHTAADSTAPRAAVSIVNANAQFARNLDQKRIIDLLKKGAFEDVMRGIPWQDLENLMAQGISEESIRAMKKTADATNATTGKIIREATGIKPTLTFDPTNPRVDRFLEKSTGNLIKDVTEASRKAVNRAIREAQAKEMPPIETFRKIKNSVGLLESQVVAVNNFEQGLRDKGFAKSTIDKRVRQFEKRQHAIRAERIARTEMMVAANQGQQIGWEQASDEGLFDKESAEVIWIVTPDDRLCPTCAPMQDVPRPVDGVWTVEIRRKSGAVVGTKTVKVPNEVHPNCRCAMQLVLKPQG